jgi:nucleotide-binding universal stress UspA family protein
MAWRWAATSVAAMEPQQSEARAPILAAFSPSAPAREPVEFGLAASRLTGAPLVVIAVRHSGAVVSPIAGDIDDAPDADRTIEHLRLDLQRRGLRDVAVEEVKARTVGEGLGQAIEAHKALLVVIGSSPRGRAGTVLLGSSAGELVHQGRCPVAVVPKDHRLPDEGVKVVGGAFELGDDGAEALLSAAALASSAGVRLRAVTVVDAKEAADPADVEARVRELLGDAAGDFDLEVEVRTGDPADELVAASQDVGLLVIGSRGRRARKAAILGSVSQAVSAKAACPVLILPPGTSAPQVQAPRESDRGVSP